MDHFCLHSFNMLKTTSFLIIMSRLYLLRCDSLNKSDILDRIYEHNHVDDDSDSEQPSGESESSILQFDPGFMPVKYGTENQNVYGNSEELEGSGDQNHTDFPDPADTTEINKTKTEPTEVDQTDHVVVYPHDGCIEPGYNQICSGKGICLDHKCKCDSVTYFDEVLNFTVSYSYSGNYCEECPYCKGQRCRNFMPCIECNLMGAANKNDCTGICPNILRKVEKVAKIVEETEKICEVESNAGCFFKFKYFYNQNGQVEVEFEQNFICLNGTKFLIFSFWIVVAYIILLMIVVPKMCPVLDLSTKVKRSVNSLSLHTDIIRLDNRNFY